MEQNKELITRLHRLETDVKDFKAPQPIGTDSVRTYTTLSNNQWDITWTSTGAGAWNRYKIWFKSQHQDAPFGRLRVFAEFNGVNYDPSTSSTAYLSSTRPYVAVYDNVLRATPDELKDPRLLRFIVEVSAPATGVVVKLKYVVDATDTGRLTWDNGQN